MKFWFAAGVMLLLAGCELGYYSHLANGQFQLWRARQPTTELIQAEQTPSFLKERLALTEALRSFAKDTLGLPITDQYTTFVQLDRSYAVWSLAAAPPFSLSSKKWCYPFLGCMGYRGYFSEDKAQTHAAALTAQGLEVSVRGVSAFSSLGWFADPVLSSFVQYPEQTYVELIFHELAHSQLYLSNQTTFNESFAQFVGLKAAEQFLKQTGRQWQAQQPLAAQQFFKLAGELRYDLSTIYSQQTPLEAKRALKQARMAQFFQQFRAEQVLIPELARFQSWADDMNNAILAELNYYDALIPKFEQLFMDCDQRWSCFYEASARYGEALQNI